MTWKNKLGTWALVAGALGGATACYEAPDHYEYECEFESLCEDCSVTVCIPREWNNVFPKPACQLMCEELQASGELWLEGTDCSQATAKDVTDKQFPCEPDRDWEKAILEDPDSNFTHKYRCQGPAGSGQLSCQQGDYSATWGLPFVEVCGSPSESMDSIHQRCIAKCQDLFAEANALSECSFPDSWCDAYDYPFELSGVACDKSSAAPFNPSGDRYENLIWSTRDGGSASRPLACSVAGDCCEPFGREVCGNLRLGTSLQPRAEVVSPLRGTLTFDDGVSRPAVATVSATVSTSQRRCANPSGTCPLYVEALRIDLVGGVSGVRLEGASYDIDRLVAVLEKPMLGVADASTGAAMLPSDRTALRVTASARVEERGMSLGFDEQLTLPTHLEARIGAGGELTNLAARVPLQGTSLTVRLELNAVERTRGVQ